MLFHTSKTSLQTGSLRIQPKMLCFVNHKENEDLRQIFQYRSNQPVWFYRNGTLISSNESQQLYWTTLDNRINSMLWLITNWLELGKMQPGILARQNLF